MRAISIAILGVGPRGLTTIDRISSLYRHRKISQPVDLHIVDPGEPGEGVHDHRQPPFLLTNTACGVISAFPQTPIGDAPIKKGPTLAEWSRDRGYRRYGVNFLLTGPCGGDDIDDQDYLPRHVLGEYLSWYFDRIVAELPEGIGIRHHRDRAVRVHVKEGGLCLIELSSGYTIAGDYLVISTGHSSETHSEEYRRIDTFVRQNISRNNKLRYIANPYPIGQLSVINPQATVALRGLGPTAHDVIASLTLGRGGRYEEDGRSLSYRPTGREPRILLFSRSCLPFCARGVARLDSTQPYSPVFFTDDAVAARRRAVFESDGRGQLDFEADFLPLLIKETAYVYRCANDHVRIEPRSYQMSDADRRAVENILYPVRDETFLNIDHFRRFFIDYIQADLVEIEQNGSRSPKTAVAEVVRYVRNTLRLLVEYDGLTERSHRQFLDRHHPMMQRITYGLPKRRNQELLALFAAGIVDVASGPEPSLGTEADRGQFRIDTSFKDGLRHTAFADVLVNGSANMLHPEQDAAPLYRSMLQDGIVRPHRNGDYRPGGVDIDRSNRVIDREGRPVRNIWVVGFPAEGTHFFTYALPHSWIRSRHVIDIDKCVIQMFESMADIGMSVHDSRQDRPVEEGSEQVRVAS